VVDTRSLLLQKPVVGSWGLDVRIREAVGGLKQDAFVLPQLPPNLAPFGRAGQPPSLRRMWRVPPVPPAPLHAAGGPRSPTDEQAGAPDIHEGVVDMDGRERARHGLGQCGQGLRTRM
jgi:hypothetical protein